MATRGRKPLLDECIDHFIKCDFNVSKFDENALRKGIEVEMEHTDNHELAKCIAMAHLNESPQYYDYLERMESMLPGKAYSRKDWAESLFGKK